MSFIVKDSKYVTETVQAIALLEEQGRIAVLSYSNIFTLSYTTAGMPNIIALLQSKGIPVCERPDFQRWRYELAHKVEDAAGLEEYEDLKRSLANLPEHYWMFEAYSKRLNEAIRKIH